MKDIYQSIECGISAEEEIKKFHEITRLDFHRILKDDLRGDKHKFLEGFRKGLEYGLHIFENRSKIYWNKKKNLCQICIISKFYILYR